MAIKKKIKASANEEVSHVLRRVEAGLSTTATEPDRVIGDWEIYICSGPPKIRSIGYNGYYWGIVVKTVADHTGFHSSEVHTWFKSRFAIEFVHVFDEVIQTSKSTSNMSTADFADYVDMCRIAGMEIISGYIPLPNELPDEVLVEMVNRGEV